LGTPRTITNAIDNTKVWEWKNDDAFGNNPPDENPASANVPPFKYHLRFPGQYFDQETGTYYNYFRDYDPNIGRYIESDPIGLRGGLNTYGYTEASPLTHKDEKGLLRFGVGVVILGWFGYELADKYRAEKSCALSCKLQCENIRACGDEERNDALQNNIPRCIASCIPLCVAEFVGGPSKGPTGKAIPQP